MANEKKLDCVMLGMLSHEPLTGYEIKRRMDSALKHFWGASYGSIYPALADLVRRGLATGEECCGNKRKRYIYTITDAGREYLRNWLAQPVNKDELRYETLLKVFFGNEAGQEQTAEHIRAFRDRADTALTELLMAESVLKSAPDDDGTHANYLLTVRFGIKTYKAYVEWCDEALAALSEK
ncbi:MAG: PadR family transcriptional regulator [Ruminococcaceae bacterium]|nr:PadR family transcriptional regulator [Oscillospiraceae bacterium]